ncbi:hypothetical protein D9M68_707590 [compost metagenome]
MRRLPRQGLQRLDRQGRLGGDAFGQGHGPVEQCRRAFRDFRDQADGLGPGGIDAFPGQRHLHGMGRWYRLQQAMQAGHRRDRAHHRFRQAEAGVAGSDAQVALQRQFQAAAQAVAVHRGDQRLAQVEVGEVHQADVEPGLGCRLLVEEQCLGIGGGRASRALQVGADAEGALAGTGDDRRADIAAIADLFQVPTQGTQGIQVQGVEGLGAVQGDQGDGSMELQDHGHGGLLTRWPRTGCARHRHRGSAR